LNTQVRNATPEEAIEWSQNDYLLSMKFDPLVLFVVIPAIIQIVVLAFMLASMSVLAYFLNKVIKLLIVSALVSQHSYHLH